MKFKAFISFLHREVIPWVKLSAWIVIPYLIYVCIVADSFSYFDLTDVIFTHIRKVITVFKVILIYALLLGSFVAGLVIVFKFKFWWKPDSQKDDNPGFLWMCAAFLVTSLIYTVLINGIDITFGTNLNILAERIHNED